MAQLLYVLLVPIVLAYLFTLPWETNVTYGFDRKLDYEHHAEDTDTYSRSVHYFVSNGTRCEAWLYLPKSTDSPPPVIVAGWGLFGQRDCFLPGTFEGLAEAGIASFVIDYRYWGGSDGEPRHLVLPFHFQADYEAAAQHILDGGLGGVVDTSRVGLLGLSLGGGHAVITAGRLGDKIKAVVGQVPAIMSLPGGKSHISMLKMMRFIVIGLVDRVRSCLGLPRAYIPMLAVRGSGQFAFGESPAEEAQHFFDTCNAVDGLGGYQFRVAASVVFDLFGYLDEPIKYVPNVTCPTLLQVAIDDQVTPAEAARLALRNFTAPVDLKEYPGGHLSALKSPQVVTDLVQFFGKHLKGSTDLHVEGDVGPQQ